MVGILQEYMGECKVQLYSAGSITGTFCSCPVLIVSLVLCCCHFCHIVTAIFVVSCHCLSPYPSLLSSCGGFSSLCYGSPCCCVVVILLLIVRHCPLVIVVAICPLIINVIPSHCFCHHSSACFLSLHPFWLSHASCSFPPHEQLLMAVGCWWPSSSLPCHPLSLPCCPCCWTLACFVVLIPHPAHEQVFIAVAWVWVCHFGAVSW